MISYRYIVHPSVDLNRIEKREAVETQMLSPELAHGDIAVCNIGDNKFPHPVKCSPPADLLVGTAACIDPINGSTYTKDEHIDVLEINTDFILDGTGSSHYRTTFTDTSVSDSITLILKNREIEFSSTCIQGHLGELIMFISRIHCIKDLELILRHVRRGHKHCSTRKSLLGISDSLLPNKALDYFLKSFVAIEGQTQRINLVLPALSEDLFTVLDKAVQKVLRRAASHERTGNDTADGSTRKAIHMIG